MISSLALLLVVFHVTAWQAGQSVLKLKGLIMHKTMSRRKEEAWFLHPVTRDNYIRVKHVQKDHPRRQSAQATYSTQLKCELHDHSNQALCYVGQTTLAKTSPQRYPSAQ